MPLEHRHRLQHRLDHHQPHRRHRRERYSPPRELPEPLPTDGSKIMSGNDGMSVLLVYEGSADTGEQLARRLSRAHRKPIYLLDFHEYSSGIHEYNGTRSKWRDEQYPGEFLAAYGISPPEHKRWEPSPIIRTPAKLGCTT